MHSDYKEWKFVIFVIPRSKNEAWLPRCSTLRSNTLGHISVNDIRNCHLYSTKDISESTNPMVFIFFRRSI